MVRVELVWTWGFRKCSKAKKMTSIKKNCINVLDMMGGIGRTAVGRWKGVENQAVLCGVRDE